MRRAAKVDSNQKEIVAAMRKIGAAVTHLHQLGGGIPDLLVSWRQRWFLMEIKDKGKLNDDQIRWSSEQRAPVYLMRSPDEAVNFLKNINP